MLQASFDLQPRQLARRRDPKTSHEAAARVSEFSNPQHGTILNVLRDHGPCTAHEIADHCDIEAHAVGKRMKELATGGAIRVVLDGENKEMTRKTPSGRSARVWFRVGALA